MSFINHKIRFLVSIRSEISGFGWNLLWQVALICILASALPLVLSYGEWQSLYSVALFIAVGKVAGLALAVGLLLYVGTAFARWCILAVCPVGFGAVTWLRRWVLSLLTPRYSPVNAARLGLSAESDGPSLPAAHRWTAATAAGRAGAVSFRE